MENGQSEVIGSKTVDTPLTRKEFKEWFASYRVKRAGEALGSGKEISWERSYDVQANSLGVKLVECQSDIVTRTDAQVE